MIDLDILYAGATKICGRSVYSHDLFMDRENLMKEVETGTKRLKNGTNLSEGVQEAAVEASVGRLEKKLRGRVIKVNMASEDSDSSGYDGWLNHSS
jgi:hypothetical protein